MPDSRACCAAALLAHPAMSQSIFLAAKFRVRMLVVFLTVMFQHYVSPLLLQKVPQRWVQGG